MELILFYTGLMALVLQGIYLLFISIWKMPVGSLPAYPGKEVCVLVCVKNEEGNLSVLLPSLLSQSYKHFKILVVNDQSTDGTAEVVNYWQAKYPDRIQLFSIISKQVPGKKGAIREAIPHIHADYILFTDADCRPGSNDWILLMVGQMEKYGADMVTGYSPVIKEDSFTSDLQRMHNCWTAWQYLGAAYQGKPYMVVGRNWGVRTKLYKKYQNIADHRHIASGDDDLVFQALLNKGKATVQAHTKAWMWTKACPDLSSYFLQRIRHIEAAYQYPFTVQLVLSMFPMAVFLTFVCALVLLFSMPLVGIAVLFVQFSLWLVFGRQILRFLGQRDLLLKMSYLLPLEMAFQGVVFILTLLGMKGKWK